MTWTQPAINGTAPAARGRHSAILYNKKLYVFGGYGQANTVFGDLHCLDLGTRLLHLPVVFVSLAYLPVFSMK